ncbi:N-acetylmuramate/N-acetylglucosamine kinase [Gammaproteobacteria bacterium]
MSERLTELTHWLGNLFGAEKFQIAPASADASFRRYFRVYRNDATQIVMDAPPDKEDSRPFVALSREFRSFGLNVPEVLEADLARGFLLLTDLGTEPYLPRLGPATADRLYGDALSALMALQACGPVDAFRVPPYDARLLTFELSLFRDWFLGRHLGLVLGEGTLALLEETFALLTTSALEQPVVCVHRDYHSRNLMVTGKHNPGILDFQDAVAGPVTYDLVSLLRDCYIAWPQEQVRDWALGYHDLALQAGVIREEDPERFLGWFDRMGIQRHLKAIGIFARLNHRDGKPGYLGDIPRTLGYVLAVSARYPDLVPFHNWLCAEVLPRVENVPFIPNSLLREAVPSITPG